MIEQNETKTKPQGRVCARCGTSFVCGVAAGHADCWCFHLPRVHPVPTSNEAGCWCPTCLHTALSETDSPAKS